MPVGIVAIVVVSAVLVLFRNQLRHSGKPTVLPSFDISWGRLLAFFVVLVLLIARQPWLAAILCIAGLAPGRFARHVLVPLGIPHVTYWFLRSVHLGSGKPDALFLELCSRLRFGRGLSTSALTRLEQRLEHIMPMGYVEDTTKHSVAMVSRAILDAARGQRETARELFLVVQSLPRRLCPRGSRNLSQGWLLADATARRDFAEVLRLCGEGPRTLQRAYFRTLAQRYLGRPLAFGDHLVALCAPVACRGPLAAWRLAKLVRRAAYKSPPPLPSPEASIDLVAAKRALISAASRPVGQVSRAELRSVGRLWHTLDARDAITGGAAEFAALSGQAQSALFDARSASRELLDEVVATFEELWPHALPDEVPSDERCPLILEVEDRIEQRAMSKLERLIAQLPSAADREAPAEACWRAWARLRALSRDTIHVLPGRTESILGPLRRSMINWGAWLYNNNGCKVLGLAVFHWCLEHTPKDNASYELLENNIRLARAAL